MKYRSLFAPTIAFACLMFFSQCNDEQKTATDNTARKDTAKIKQEPAPEVNTTITYHALVMKDSGKVRLKRDFTDSMRRVIYALNRVDAGFAKRIDTLIIPDTLVEDLMFYSPFPAELSFLKDVKKIVYFSYPIQAFAAYENGKLVRWGPTSMGKKATPTPTGLFFANWKGLEVHSSVKDEWILKWNFNIWNKGGVGWHLYQMPGYPASHSCLRLLEVDARYMYDWADQWKLEGSDKILAQGTPTIVYGAYPWGQQRPWKALIQNPGANETTAEMLQKETESFLEKIMTEQKRREGVVGTDTAAIPTPGDTTTTP